MSPYIHRLPTPADVDAAARRLAGVIVRTPLLFSPELSALAGARVFVKPETLQLTGSFKFRGAYNRLVQIPETARAAGVVASSSGNHAQGVAAAAKLLGIPATIAMPTDAPALKRERTEAYGAEVIGFDRAKEDGEDIASVLAGTRGATLVPPYDDTEVIAGQGTVGLEILEDLAEQGLTPDVIAAAAGGGGLVAGIALAVKSRSPSTRVVACEPAGFDDHARSFRSGVRERNPATVGSFCDALLAPHPGAMTFEISRDLVGEAAAVDDDEVARAVAFAFRELKLVVEPGGAVALASLLEGRLHVGAGETVVIVLSGGNVDTETFIGCLTA
ncbi:threonine/serine dehydratase [Xanthobacter dioxanivorans]|uniref:Threonine/serine dehydratase n=1 Tax=Xanthobacter dioxanivorans TaxID=2528964 RepID=A0A974PLL1_9HYPH|nr:threonine/serine dehydratase [Xanthobacter dioxanivorans]QRG05847.1 threonine/serine dehydratase [Xanthobacter dioxanivorans]